MAHTRTTGKTDNAVFGPSPPLIPFLNNRIDALSHSRTHLGKEKQNLEGERNALNKVVKEIKLEVTLCQKELKKLKIDRAR